MEFLVAQECCDQYDAIMSSNISTEAAKSSKTWSPSTSANFTSWIASMNLSTNPNLFNLILPEVVHLCFFAVSSAFFLSQFVHVFRFDGLKLSTMIFCYWLALFRVLDECSVRIYGTSSSFSCYCIVGTSLDVFSAEFESCENSILQMPFLFAP